MSLDFVEFSERSCVGCSEKSVLLQGSTYGFRDTMFGASKVIKYTNSDTFLIDLDLDEPIKCFSCSKYRYHDTYLRSPLYSVHT